MLPTTLIAILVAVISWRRIDTNTLYWMSVVFSSVAAPTFGLKIAVLLIRDNTGAMAGFYLPPAFFAIPITIPLAGILTFSALYLTLLRLSQNIEERIKKKGVEIRSIGSGILHTCIGAFFATILRLIVK